MSLLKKLLIISPIIVLVSLFFVTGSDTSAAEAEVLTVGFGQKYANPQDAIDAIPYSLTRPYIVRIKGGRYTSTATTVVSVRGKGTSPSNTITLESFPGETAVIDAQVARIGISVDADNVVIRGLILKDGGSNGTVKVQGANVKILNNYFYTTDDVNSFYGVVLWESQNGTVMNNTFYNEADIAIYNRGADNSLISHNTIYDAWGTTGAIRVRTQTTASSNVVITHNIISDEEGFPNTGAGINVATGNAATLTRNDVYNYASFASGGYLDGGGNITLEPGFVSEEPTDNNFLYTDPDSYTYEAGVDQTPLGARYVAAPDDLVQYENDGETEIDWGGWVNRVPLKFEATLFSPVLADQLRMELEVKKVTEKYNGVSTSLSNWVSTNAEDVSVSMDRGTLDKNAEYVWRVRAVNKVGVYSEWSTYNEDYPDGLKEGVKRIPADFGYDTVRPEGVTNAMTSSKVTTSRPIFRWKVAGKTDGLSPMGSYTLTVENEDSQFEVDDIPASRTQPVKNSKYTVTYEGFNDNDPNNNYISVKTNSSGEWCKDCNNGALELGDVTWTVTTEDTAGNVEENSFDLTYDLSNKRGT